MVLPIYADIAQAAARIEGVAHRTPVLTSRTLNAVTGAEIYIKAENFQRGGAFKFRGAFNAISALDVGTRAKGVMAFSSGNHAQGIAFAAKLHDIPAVILMPEDSPAAKLAATRGYGAEVVTYDRYTKDREALAREMATARGLTLIPPFDMAEIIAGQGTVAKELFEETGPLDMLLVCVGGGGLISGCALAAKALSPDCAVIGVEPEAGNDVQQSFQRGEIVTIEQPKTIADGAATRAPGAITFALIRELVSDVVTVPDAALVDAMRFFAERMKIIVEPTGCLAMAAAMTGAAPVAGKRVGITISGGNVDMATFSRLLAGSA